MNLWDERLRTERRQVNLLVDWILRLEEVNGTHHPDLVVQIDLFHLAALLIGTHQSSCCNRGVISWKQTPRLQCLLKKWNIKGRWQSIYVVRISNTNCCLSFNPCMPDLVSNLGNTKNNIIYCKILG